MYHELRKRGTSRRTILDIAAAAIAALVAVPALAESASQWPERPVRLLVPVGPGGAADTLSRNLSNGFSPFANGQPLIVENRPGAGGTIAAAAVAREKPDGYTLFLAEVGPNAIAHKLTSKLPYDPHNAFTPIIHAANFPAVVLIRPTLPFMTLTEFIAAAKQKPGKFNYASAGIGNWTHLFMAYLNRMAGIDQVNVAYRSGAEMLTSLLKDEADTAIITVSTSLGQIKEGKARALAGISMQPMQQLPDTPPVGRTIKASMPERTLTMQFVPVTAYGGTPLDEELEHVPPERLSQHLRGVRRHSPRDVITVFVPEYVVGRWWEQLLHNQSALRLKTRLLFEPGVMVTSVPWQLRSTRHPDQPTPITTTTRTPASTDEAGQPRAS
jgi:tripartite-type tricarboxylate transporter receptor subunit TctC